MQCTTAPRAGHHRDYHALAPSKLLLMLIVMMVNTGMLNTSQEWQHGNYHCLDRLAHLGHGAHDHLDQHDHRGKHHLSFVEVNQARGHRGEGAEGGEGRHHHRHLNEDDAAADANAPPLPSPHSPTMTLPRGGVGLPSLKWNLQSSQSESIRSENSDSSSFSPSRSPSPESSSFSRCSSPFCRSNHSFPPAALCKMLLG